MDFVALILVAGLLAAWWCELTAKVEVGSIRELYLGENHPLTGKVVRIDHKGLFFWRVYVQRCVRGYTENDGQLVRVKGSDENGTGAIYNVVNGFTEDDSWAYIPIWLIRAIMKPEMNHSNTEGMRYVGGVNDERRLNSWFSDN